jgi:hypothetical protein
MLKRTAARMTAEFNEEVQEMRVTHNEALAITLQQAEKQFKKTKDNGFLKTKLRALEQHAKLWGINAPERSESKHSGDPATVIVTTGFLTRDAMRKEIDQRLAKLKRR